MSRVQYSLEGGVAAVPPQPVTHLFRATRGPSLPSRREMRRAVENLGLFAFGFGTTTLLIHFAVGLFAAARMTSALPPFTL
ncbi:hypothetical protein [Methylocystis parvus]|uniref:Uncharacterized protein n=1 Tax=Methylocystis parvus TaxID=134 RepID=A0A6B8M4Q6_9HYPH|nr:hypothetical protein [Methylocystis parvus]QGM97102.1 hypothetical protein F7D14_06180 [Methylocystis parvus]WBJ98995.1 hypothetical protein MMG94_13430 [Methylocystis parvus OBBP]